MVFEACNCCLFWSYVEVNDDYIHVCVQDGVEISRGHVLQLQDATFDTAGRYECEVTVPTIPGLHTSGSVHIIVQGKPSSRAVPMSHVRRVQSAGLCQCHIPSISYLHTHQQGFQHWNSVYISINMVYVAKDKICTLY